MLVSNLSFSLVLLRIDSSGLQPLGQAELHELIPATLAYDPTQFAMAPRSVDWVYVLEGQERGSGHQRLGAVQSGERFAHRGIVCETAAASPLAIRPTDLRLGRVRQTIARTASGVVAVTVEDEAGGSAIIEATGEHPIWVGGTDKGGGYVVSTRRTHG